MPLGNWICNITGPGEVSVTSDNLDAEIIFTDITDESVLFCDRIFENESEDPLCIEISPAVLFDGVATVEHTGALVLQPEIPLDVGFELIFIGASAGETYATEHVLVEFGEC